MSSEQPFEHIEHKIKEASENIPIAFDESAWKKMEALLDKNDKRRPFFWLWLLVPIILLGGWYFIGQNKQQKSGNPLASKTPVKTIDTTNSFTQTTQATRPTAPASIGKNGLLQNNINANVNGIYSKKNTTLVTKNNDRVFSKNAKEPLFVNNAEDDNIVSQMKRINEKAKMDISVSSPTSETNRAGNKIAEANNTTTEAINITGDSEKLDQQKEIANSKTSIKKDTILPNEKKTDAKKSNKISSRFYLLAGIGADMGSVKLLSFKNSTLAPRYGLGLGYEFNKKIAVQTGLYISNKKYLAGPKDYNVKQGSYLSQVEIISVDANCLVYEIPIVFRYNFIQRPTTSYYSSVGISSYVMKKEDYNYKFKAYYTTLEYPYAYTGNKHLFSNMQFSLGAEKTITKRVAIQIEPAVSIPLSGVGEGGVRLFSASLQLGLRYHPFK